MRNVLVNSATQRELDYLLAKANVALVWWDGDLPFEATSDCADPKFQPTTNWAQGGPLIEKYSIVLVRCGDTVIVGTNTQWWPDEEGDTDGVDVWVAGLGHLDAAMRCLATTIYGETAIVPDNLQ